MILSSPDTWPRRPLLMGIVNVTPDSFSDGGQFLRWERAVAHALDLTREGADVLDIGGESTRPGAVPVTVEEEIRRVRPVIAALTGETDVPLSIDTRHAAVAEAAIEAGATWVNDVSALGDPEMSTVIKRCGVGVCLMHMRGDPATMQEDPVYRDVVAEVTHFLRDAAERARATRIPREQVWVDPGIGFGKTVQHNLQLLANLDRLASLGYPVLVGASRKSFVGNIAGDAVENRLPGSLAAADAARSLRRVILRVHDVAATRQFLMVRESIRAEATSVWDLPPRPILHRVLRAE